eukprot:GHVH01004554.1.p1 GENE.GHVH01004554.1~~GHVH01004554.1.p1  ORF type:complete len:366 (+),score=63.52 GHVH01004554.1:56-1153(+)
MDTLMKGIYEDITKRASPGVINIDAQGPDGGAVVEQEEQRSSLSIEEDVYPSQGMRGDLEQLSEALSGATKEDPIRVAVQDAPMVSPRQSPEVEDARRSDSTEMIGEMVYLNVYDLDDQFVQVNNALSPLFTGAFHAGIECYGIEYCYGMTEEVRSGVYWHKPKQNPVHIFRRSHLLGPCALSREAYQRLMGSKLELWLGNEYHLFRKNCISFCEDLAKDLQVFPRFPVYVSSLMNTATKAADGYLAASDFIQSATSSYVSTVDIIGDEILGSVTKASSQVNKGISTLGSSIRNAIPAFFKLTYPESDNEEEENFNNGDHSDLEKLRNCHVPPTIQSYMSVPNSAKAMDQGISDLIQDGLTDSKG